MEMLKSWSGGGYYSTTNMIFIVLQLNGKHLAANKLFYITFIDLTHPTGCQLVSKTSEESMCGCLAGVIEPRCEKTGLRGFRPGPTQTGLYNHRIWLES